MPDEQLPEIELCARERGHVLTALTIQMIDDIRKRYPQVDGPEKLYCPIVRRMAEVVKYQWVKPC